MAFTPRAKIAFLSVARQAHLFHWAMPSGWRRNRLLILGFHAISLEDEHKWEPNLYISSTQFERRLQALRTTGCSVLPVDEAVGRHRSGILPEASVAITFDDGFMISARWLGPCYAGIPYRRHCT